MYGRFVIFAAAVVGLFWFLSWFRNTPPEKVARVLRQTALFAAIGFFILLAITGRLHWVFAAAAAAVAVLLRLLNLLLALPVIRQLIGGLRSGQPDSLSGGRGQTSSIHTRFLDMRLDHDSGELDGSVLEGPYQGLRLSELGLDQLIELLACCWREDEQSAAVLEAYMDRNFGDDWRETVDSSPGGGDKNQTGPMTVSEAWAVLGLAPGADENEIREAHRRLIQKLHPDRGGSTYLAAKINQAKDVLLA
jgi:hypothetical protein